MNVCRLFLLFVLSRLIHHIRNTSTNPIKGLEAPCSKGAKPRIGLQSKIERHQKYESIEISPSPRPMVQQPAVGQVLAIIKDSRSHSDTPQTVGLLWMRDQSDKETSA